MKYTWEEMFDMLIEYLGVSEEALQLACAIGGCNEETMERVLFYYTGWRSFEGFLNELNEEEEE